MPSASFHSYCPDWASAVLNGFSQIFLQRHPLCGLLCLLAILIGAPALLGGALLGGVAGLLTAQRRGYPKADRQAGLFSYNGVLLGLLLSLYFPWSVLLPPLIVACGGVSAILTQQWLKRSRDHHCLPAYTAPFVGLSWLLLSVADPMQPAPPPLAEPGLLELLSATAKGLGQVMFLDQPLAGALIALGLFLANRRTAAWALFASAAGLGFSLLHHEYPSALLGLGGYNAVLVAIALPATTSPMLAASARYRPGPAADARLRRPWPGALDRAVYPRCLAGARLAPDDAPGGPGQCALHCKGQST